MVSRTNKISSSNKKGISGIFQIELALATGVSLMFLLGAFNLTNIFRAKTAAMQGVKSALKCLTPADAECRNYLYNAEPKYTNYYDIYEVEPLDTSLKKIKRYHYDLLGSGELLKVSEYELKNFEAKVINSIVLPTKSFVATKEEYSAQGTGNYLLRSFPTIRFNDPNNRDAGYRIFNRDLNGNIYQWNENRIFVRNFSSSNTVNGLSREDIVLNIPDNTANNINTDIPCFNKKILPNSNLLGSCETFNEFSGISTSNISTKDQLHRQTYGVLVVEGRAISGSGTILLSMRSKDSSGNWVTRELGGQNISSSQSGNRSDFIPRGAPISNYKNIDNYSEPSLHQAIKFPIGENFKLSFVGTTRDIIYQIDKVAVYLPDYQPITETNLCSKRLTQSEFNLQNCSIKLNDFDNLITANNLSIVSSNIVENKEFACYQDLTSAKSEFINWQNVFDKDKNFKFQESSTDCTTQGIEYSCSTNYGVSPGDKDNFEAVKNSCNPLESNNKKIVSTPPFTFKEKTISFATYNESLFMKPKSCLNPCLSKEDLPPELKQYQDLNYQCNPSGNVEYYADNSQGYDTLVSNTPESSCQYHNFASTPISSLITESQLIGKDLNDLGCGWEEKLIAEFYQKTTLPKNSEIVLSAIRNDTGQESIISDSVDSCTNFKVINTSDSKERLYKEGVLEDQVTSYCAELNNNNQQCKVVLNTQKITGESNGNYDNRFAPAKQRLEQSIKKLLPLSDGKFNIVKTEISETDDKESYKVSTEIEVPLFLLKNSLKIKYHEVGLKER